MKILFILNILLFLASCNHSQEQYVMDRHKLQERIWDDNNEEYNYFWSYRGSDDTFHYFERGIARLMVRDNADGLYKISKDDFQINHPVIPYSKDNGVYLDCFTYLKPNNRLDIRYDIRVNVLPESYPIPFIDNENDISDRNNWYLENGDKWLGEDLKVSGSEKGISTFNQETDD